MKRHWSTVADCLQSELHHLVTFLDMFIHRHVFFQCGSPLDPPRPHPTPPICSTWSPVNLHCYSRPHVFLTLACIFIILFASTEWTALSSACLSALLQDAPEWRLLKHNFCLLWFHVSVALPSLCVWLLYPCWIKEDAGCISSRKEKQFAVCPVVTDGL